MKKFLKIKYPILIAVSFVMLFQNFSFASGMSYQYMKDQNMKNQNMQDQILPLSHALYLKEDGTVCMADFESQPGSQDQEDQNNLLTQYKKSVAKCSNEDMPAINNMALEYLNNENNSFKVTKVVLPAIAMANIASASLGCLIGFIDADTALRVYRDDVVLDPNLLNLKDSTIITGSLTGSLMGIPLLALFGKRMSFNSLFINGFIVAAIGATSTFICSKATIDKAIHNSNDALYNRGD